MENKKYPALFTIANFLRALGVITIIWTAVLVIIGIISVFVSGQYLGVGLFGFLGELLGAVFGSIMVLILYSIAGGTVAVFYFASAESIQLLLGIEKNTRTK